MIPIISVLIPTRNRALYLASLISIIESCSDERIEFLISDNSDVPEQYSDNIPNAKFFRPVSVLNMTDHWNFLLDKASGQYITFIGDDDAFMPTSLRNLCDLLQNQSPDIVWTQTAGYGWPVNGAHGNFFQEIARKNKRLDLDEARSELLYLKSTDLPIPYNYALVRREIILSFLKHNPGESFFSSRVPDINAGVKTLFLAQSQFEYPRLTFISGASPLSNGLLSRTNQNHPAALEFNNPDFNPVRIRQKSQNSEVSPFGFMTYFEAIEESLLQLNKEVLAAPRRLAFRSVIQSSYPTQQLGISQRIWPSHLMVLRIGYWARRLLDLKFCRYTYSKFKLLSLGARILFNRVKIVVIHGPGIQDTSSLVIYIEAHQPRLEGRPIIKIRVDESNLSNNRV
jgi:glycosyltransferase involved in cell wall biosynthesis